MYVIEEGTNILPITFKQNQMYINQKILPMGKIVPSDIVQ